MKREDLGRTLELRELPLPSDRPRKIFFSIAVMIIVFVLVGAIGVSLMKPSDDCVNHASSRVNIILDRTGFYSEIQKLNLDKSVASIVKAAKQNAQINVFYMTDDGDRPKTVLSLCRPNDVSPITGDPEEFQLELQHNIIDPIRKVIDLPLRKTNQVPIVETLDTLSRERLIAVDNGANSVYIFSDMIQNSKAGSLLNCSTAYKPEPALQSYSDRVRQFYSDVPVGVFAIVRNPSRYPGLPSSRCLRLFWESVLGGSIKSWEPI